jgi:hypothetical protein
MQQILKGLGVALEVGAMPRYRSSMRVPASGVCVLRERMVMRNQSLLVVFGRVKVRVCLSRGRYM